MLELAQTAGAVDFGCVIQFLGYALQTGEER